MLRRMSEKRPDYSCTWCNMYAGSLRGLVSHLVSSHSRFRFHVVAGYDGIPQIFVIPRNVRATGNVNGHGEVCELNLENDQVLDSIEHNVLYLSARKRGKIDNDQAIPCIQEFDDLERGDDEKILKFYTPLLQRQYFHSRTGAVVLDHEKGYDSDVDVDETWITQQSERVYVHHIVYI